MKSKNSLKLTHLQLKKKTMVHTGDQCFSDHYNGGHQFAVVKFFLKTQLHARTQSSSSAGTSVDPSALSIMLLFPIF